VLDRAGGVSQLLAFTRLMTPVRPVGGRQPDVGDGGRSRSVSGTESRSSICSEPRSNVALARTSLDALVTLVARAPVSREAGD
jgi:hypothetical protein